MLEELISCSCNKNKILFFYKKNMETIKKLIKLKIWQKEMIEKKPSVPIFSEINWCIQPK